jgi:hypothetical protein
MNKNTFMSPLRGLALASVATAVLSSCAKDEFTERQALSLELQKLRAQREVDSLARVQQRIYDINTLRYQRALDSLDRINAGGRVFYSVAVVSGSSGAFSSGRSEEVEGVAGATVSISQYGAVTTVTTPASGLATAELRSGAAAVVISAPNHTTVNYVVNLTPDGSTQIGTPGNVVRNAPGNGTTVYVSNVMPLFQTGGANAATQMGTVRGLALIETNLTNDAPEIVTPALLGTGTNLLTANIDVNSAFMARYINNRANNSTTIPTNQGTNGWEGDVQRVVYETATSVATLDATGAYSVLVPATASGLPIRLKYSDIATNRTWWAGRFDGIDHNAVINRRFIYGPNVTAPTGGIVVGNMPGQVRLTQTLSVVTTEATGAVTVNNPGNLVSEFPNADGVAAGLASNVRYYVFRAGATDRLRYVPGGSAGAYLANDNRGASVPTVTFAAAPAGGTTATGEVELSGPDAATNLRTVRGVRATNAGAGYTAAAAATFTEGFNFTGVTGTGTLQAPTDQLGSVQVIDGGFGFRSAGGAPYGTTGQWTERAPTILFSGNQTLTAPKTTPAVRYVRDGAVAGFVNGISNVGTTLGTIQRIEVVGAGTGITPADLATITFDYGSGAVIPANDGAGNGGDALFVANGSGGLEFNSNYGTGTTATTLNLIASLGSANGISRGARPYVFVPSASITGSTAGSGATFAVQVAADGLISEVRIATPGSSFTTASVSAATAVISTPANSLSARAFLRGTGIDNYVYDVATLAAANVVGTFNTQLKQPTTSLPPFGGLAAQNNYVAVFDAPTGAGGVQAEGVPVFDAQNRIVGLEITNPGVGYSAPVRFRIVAASATTAFRQAGNAGGSVGIVGRNISIALTGGTGYSLLPQVYFTGGGVLLSGQRNSVANPTDFSFDYDEATGNLISLSYSGPFYWDLNALATDPIRVLISSENDRIALSRAYEAFLDQASAATTAGIIYAVPGPNGSIRAIQMVRASSTFPGDIEDYLNGHVTQLDTVEWYTRTQPNTYFNTTSFIVPPRITFQGTGATPGTGLTGAFVLAGTTAGAPASGTPISGGGGTGGRIRNLRIINGGSGYVSGPITFNSRTVGRATDTNTNIFAFVGTYTINYLTLRTSPNFYAQLRAGVPFTAVGTGTENGGLFNLEAFSGITYVRDIHYGTGVYVDN